ncbi:hypothetical protein, partial [Catenulispora rubra]|uniref:hypothetical protein n=1 Tax=Catenulispora rubra TaxID=280293 RepID=UPI001E585795
VGPGWCASERGSAGEGVPGPRSEVWWFDLAQPPEVELGFELDHRRPDVVLGDFLGVITAERGQLVAAVGVGGRAEDEPDGDRDLRRERCEPRVQTEDLLLASVGRAPLRVQVVDLQQAAGVSVDLSLPLDAVALGLQVLGCDAAFFRGLLGTAAGDHECDDDGRYGATCGEPGGEVAKVDRAHSASAL